MKYRYIALDRNPKRVWPIQLPSGGVVMVPSSHWIETEHDLSAWVGGLIMGGPVAENAEPIAQPIAQKEVVVEPPKDRMAAFADALGNAFAKPAPKPAVEPVVVPAPAPVEPVVEPASEPVAAPVEAASDAVEELVEAAAEAAENDFASMTRKQLWAEVVSRGLNAGLVYNNTTKAEMVRLLEA